ncbi:MAG: hybrid sensor histidine kinase/response regulator [Acidobacteria bacterium]|nr:MAG: hybrid sensor histidine kinase/response regulator [Acidobacteriota bacterium]
MNQRLSFSQTAKVGSRQLLVIDENADDCALMAFVLSKELPGLEIVRAVDEDAFAQVLGRHPPTAVVTEYRLAWTDGFHVLDRVRRVLPTCPVVLFTGSGGEELVRQALKSGFSDYVAKSPRGYLRLVRRIEACLETPLPAKSKPESPNPNPVTAADQSMELLHAVSHDLQEPLRGISRFSRLLEEKLTEADPDIKRYLRHVVEASDRMRAMLDDYLEYLNVGKDKENGEDADLETALDSAIGNLGARIEDSGTVIKRGPLPVVAAGFNDMVRLFQNLLENAVKFRSPATPQLDISSERLRAVWLLAVKDNGIGIDPADFQRIFQMHRRLHPASQFPGNGMGLAICKRIVEQYGGRIWVDSQPGLGSTFYVTLPPGRESITEATFETA